MNTWVMTTTPTLTLPVQFIPSPTRTLTLKLTLTLTLTVTVIATVIATVIVKVIATVTTILIPWSIDKRGSW